MSVFNAGSFNYPFIRSIYDLFEIFISYNVVGNESTDRDNLRTFEICNNLYSPFGRAALDHTASS